MGYKEGSEVPVPGEFTAQLIDLISTPADGVNRNPHINWRGARLAVQSTLVSYNDGYQLQSNGVVVWYPDAQAEQVWSSRAFSFENGVIATVSGGHPEGCAQLPEELEIALNGLAQASLESPVDS